MTHYVTRIVVAVALAITLAASGAVAETASHASTSTVQAGGCCSN